MKVQRTSFTARSRRGMVGMALVGLGFFSGCSNTLETGYEPRTLGSSSEVRRAYYASPYTAEAIRGGQSVNDPLSDIHSMRGRGNGH